LVADLHHFDEKHDPNPHRIENSDPDPHRGEKADPDPHHSEMRIRIRIIVKSRIRIRIKMKRRIRICIKVKGNPNPDSNSSNSDRQHCLIETTRTLEQDSVLAGGRPERQLVEGDDLTARLQDTLACLLRDAQRAESHLRNLKDPTQSEVKLV
jgi:hypothetical protein